MMINLIMESVMHLPRIGMIMKPSRVIETINTWKSQIIGKVFTSFDAWLPI